jgi:hypothetical protein
VRYGETFRRLPVGGASITGFGAIVEKKLPPFQSHTTSARVAPVLFVKIFTRVSPPRNSEELDMLAEDISNQMLNKPHRAVILKEPERYLSLYPRQAARGN